MKKTRTIVVVFIVFAAGLYGAYSFGKRSGNLGTEPQTATQAAPTATPEPTEPQALSVRVAMIEQRDIELTQTFYGTAVPYADANVQGKYGGKIIYLKAEEGDDVQKGQTVVRFDDSDTQLQLQQAEANKNSTLERVKQAESDFETIQADLKRQEELFKEGIVPQKTVDDFQNRLQGAQSALNTAREGVNQANSQIDQLNNTLKDLQIAAPISGVVDEKQYSLNEIYQAGSVLYHIIDIDQVYIEIEVPESYISLVKENMGVAVFFDSLVEQDFSGSIERIAPKGDPQSRSFLAKAVVKNAERAIKPGMFARVQVMVKNLPQALVVDRKALVEEGESAYVITVVDNVAQKVAVTILHSDETSVALEGAGIQAGDTIVIDKAGQLQGGEAVKPL